jgi:glycosyltransferase involved in cell wall biosynthesis
MGGPVDLQSEGGFAVDGMAASVCVIVPMYNEAAVVSQVIRELRHRFEFVVCIDDGSTDGSAEIARTAGAIVVRHPVNLGQGAALRTGMEYALRHSAVEHIVTFDADGQHSVDDAERLWQLAVTVGVDVVLGSRFLTAAGLDGLPSGRRRLLRLATLYTRLTTGLTVSDTHNGLRVLSRNAADGLKLRQAGMAHASELLALIARLGLTTREASVTIAYTDYSRSKGQSNLNVVTILHELFTARLRATS